MFELVFFLVLRDLVESILYYLNPTRQGMSTNDLGPETSQVFTPNFPAAITQAFQVNLFSKSNNGHAQL